MSTHSVRFDATFSLSSYRRAIAEMFGGLDVGQQRELVEKLALLPRHIHQLASSGQIAVHLK